MKTKVFATLLVFFTIKSQSQHIEYLNANNINIGIGIGGGLFSVIEDSIATNADSAAMKFESPQGSGIKSVFSASLWMSAMSQNNLHVSYQRYRQFESYFQDGPVSSTYNTAYDNYYRRVFKITQAQIDSFLLMLPWANVNTIPWIILFWPAKSNQMVLDSFGITIPNALAPFVDKNHDGIYDPLNGDYPKLCGKEGIFFVFNDERVNRNPSDSCEKLGVEIRGFAELFIDTNSSLEKGAINNSVFVSYEIENKSTNNYTDFRLGVFEDPDLGNYSNDRVGCDSVHNLMFAYNQGNDVDFQGLRGFQPYESAHGVVLLNSKLDVFSYYTNSSPVSHSDPVSCLEVDRALHARWNDGESFTQGETGYGGSLPVNLIFPGSPNDSAQWSEINSLLPPGDRRMMGASVVGDFVPGETIKIDLAFFVSYDSTTTDFQIVDSLKRDAVIVQNFYNTQIYSCRQQTATNIAAELKADGFCIYPNPTSDKLNILLNEELTGGTMTIYDFTGRIIYSAEISDSKLSMNISEFENGGYVAEVRKDKMTKRVRWMKL